MKNCCENNNKKGFLKGLLYGTLPHSFCIFFILVSVAGSAFFATLLKPFLMSASFFHLLIMISFVMATVSAIVYLKRRKELSLSGLVSGKRYLALLYGTTLAVNIILFLLIFPVAANLGSGSGLTASVTQAFGLRETEMSGDFFWAEVDIPCSGHSPLISGELRGLEGVGRVVFSFPNIFKVEYDSEIVSKEEILSLEVFEVYPIKMR